MPSRTSFRSAQAPLTPRATSQPRQTSPYQPRQYRVKHHPALSPGPSGDHNRLRVRFSSLRSLPWDESSPPGSAGMVIRSLAGWLRTRANSLTTSMPPFLQVQNPDCSYYLLKCI
ncbi:hypothetical protein BDR07DRAFT_1410652 [Suillus spraguei]|nr:hypothetical protein BDR07DRAFT_1410652 [Suillus spraguei]